jgi:type III secretory pathway component EscT
MSARAGEKRSKSYFARENFFEKSSPSRSLSKNFWGNLFAEFVAILFWMSGTVFHIIKHS